MGFHVLTFFSVGFWCLIAGIAIGFWLRGQVLKEVLREERRQGFDAGFHFGVNQKRGVRAP